MVWGGFVKSKKNRVSLSNTMNTSESREQQLFLVAGGVILALILGVVVFNVLKKSGEEGAEAARIVSRPVASVSTSEGPESGEADKATSWIDALAPAQVFRTTEKPSPTVAPAKDTPQPDAPSAPASAGAGVARVREVVPAGPAVVPLPGSWSPNAAVVESERRLALDESERSDGEGDEGFSVGDPYAEGDAYAEEDFYSEAYATYPEEGGYPDGYRPQEGDVPYLDEARVPAGGEGVAGESRAAMSSLRLQPRSLRDVKSGRYPSTVFRSPSPRLRASSRLSKRPPVDRQRSVQRQRQGSGQAHRYTTSPLRVVRELPPGHFVASAPEPFVGNLPASSVVSSAPQPSRGSAPDPSMATPGSASERAGGVTPGLDAVLDASSAPLSAPDVQTRAMLRPASAPDVNAGPGLETGYWVRLASFSSEINALKLLQRLSSTLFEGERLPMTKNDTLLGDKMYYRVQMGPFSDYTQADRAVQLVRDQLDISGMIISPKK